MGTFVSALVPRLNNIFININSNQEKIHIYTCFDKILAFVYYTKF